MTLLRRSLAVLAVALPMACWAGDRNLCKAGEVVVFGCRSGTKLISVCASPGVTATSGYLQYRFGTRSKIELQHPDPIKPPRDRFWLSSTPYSGGSEARLRFENDGNRYTVFSSVIRTGFGGSNKPKFRSGVGVSKVGKKSQTVLCAKGAEGDLDVAALQKIDVEEFDDSYSP